MGYMVLTDELSVALSLLCFCCYPSDSTRQVSLVKPDLRNLLEQQKEKGGDGEAVWVRPVGKSNGKMSQVSDATTTTTWSEPFRRLHAALREQAIPPIKLVWARSRSDSKALGHARVHRVPARHRMATRCRACPNYSLFDRTLRLDERLPCLECS